MGLYDCNGILDNTEELRKQMDEQGYFFIRQLHNRDDVLSAREAVLQHIQSKVPEAFDPDKPLQDGVLKLDTEDKKNKFKEVTSRIQVKQFFRKFFGQDSKTFTYKWLRAVEPCGFTGVHVDNVYMSRGTDKLLTVWTPFSDVTMEMGSLAMCEGSHKLPSFDHFQDTYGSLDLDKEGVVGSGWFSEDANEITQRFGGKWKIADFKAGDVLIFTQRTVHMSSVNATQRVRISCDTRWLAESDVADPRYMAPIAPRKPKYGSFGLGVQVAPDAVTMEKKKREWGFL
ncbi:predicted protein [Nematostella vectensis]|uniref:Phytanoyl-CoA dioxygenase n=1 Tax=Nematostella vectensis TaxID=45351 RepID=A7RWJ6_NEMVE|nr:predicted protein [Nematostella vectensis]|eukprot:XP_001636198.1 predicted protein [Nematostella vectensis]